MFQGNQSEIQWGKNGDNSYTGYSRHIDIHYFFAKDRVEINNITIAYCRKYHILVDFITKSLQGVLFAKKSEVIIVWKHVDTPQMALPSTKEHAVNVVGIGSNK